MGNATGADTLRSVAGKIVREAKMDNPVSPETLELLGRVSTNTLTGLMIKLAGLRTRAVLGVRPLVPSRSRFVGPAFTVRYVPIREDLTDRASMASPNSHLHGTYDRIPRGSVLVMDMMRNDTCGCLGDVLVAGLIARGVAGLVCDGGIRDGEAIAGMTLPENAVQAPPTLSMAGSATSSCQVS